MGQHKSFTDRTLHQLDGLGLGRKQGTPWFDPTVVFNPFEPQTFQFEGLPLFSSVVSDRSSPRSDLPVNEPINDAVFTQLFKRSPDALTLSTLEEGRFVAANDRFLELSGYTLAEIIDSTSIELKLWPEPKNRLHLLEKLKQQGALYNEEGGFLTKSGQGKTVRVSAEIIPVNGARYVLCSIRDITQEKKAEEALKLANERDRLLGQISLNIRKSLNLDQILQTTVAEVREFLGVERVFIANFDETKVGRVSAESVQAPFPSLAGEVVGKDVYDELSEVYQRTPIRVINDTDISQLQESCLRLLVQRYQVKAGLGVPIILNGELFGVLVAHQCADPRPWTEFEQQLLASLATQVAIAIQQSDLYSKVQFLNTHLEQQVQERTIDLEQRSLELEQRSQELEELGKFRDFLLHAVTHDLRTSAVGMTMLLQSLECQAGESIRLPRGLLNNMIRAGNMQRDKLDAIQEVYQIEVQGLPLQPTAIDAASLVENVLKTLQSRIDQNQAAIDNTLSPKLPTISADTVQVERVFQHLIVNAIAHNPSGVTISIGATVAPNTDTVRFYVRDNGRGIEPQKRDRLFQLCSDCPEARTYGGISLGLYLCHQIIRSHGGSIGVESTPGEGTTIWFTLPSNRA